jgi:hypothetical protein
MNNDWWSRRLSSNSPSPQTTRTSVPTTTPAIRFPVQNQPAINTPQQQTETPATMGAARMLKESRKRGRVAFEDAERVCGKAGWLVTFLNKWEHGIA